MQADEHGRALRGKPPPLANPPQNDLCDTTIRTLMKLVGIGSQRSPLLRPGAPFWQRNGTGMCD